MFGRFHSSPPEGGKADPTLLMDMCLSPLLILLGMLGWTELWVEPLQLLLWGQNKDQPQKAICELSALLWLAEQKLLLPQAQTTAHSLLPSCLTSTGATFQPLHFQLQSVCSGGTEKNQTGREEGLRRSTRTLRLKSDAEGDFHRQCLCRAVSEGTEWDEDTGQHCSV